MAGGVEAIGAVESGTRAARRLLFEAGAE